jgi:ribosomal-protein-alanine N-acetyltransferase
LLSAEFYAYQAIIRLIIFHMHPLPNLSRFFSKFPVLDLGNIKLRDLMLSDSTRYHEIMSDPEVVKYFSDEDIPNSVEEAVNEVKFWSGLFYRKQSVFWAIVDAKDNNLIGTIGYNSWNIYNRRAEISYDLCQQYWRQGLMTKALSNTISFGFKEMGLMRIEARTMIDNKPSQAILEKLGFKLEGVMRNYRIIRGEPINVVLYTLIPDDAQLLA